MGAILSRSGMTVWICTFPIRPEKKISSMTSLWRDRRGERRSSSFENRFSSWERKTAIQFKVSVLRSGVKDPRSMPDRIRLQLLKMDPSPDPASENGSDPYSISNLFFPKKLQFLGGWEGGFSFLVFSWHALFRLEKSENISKKCYFLEIFSKKKFFF
jgi:hypothetical protein